MEQKTGRDLRVGDLDVDSFVELLSMVLDRKREKGDPRLMDLSVKEFTTFMVDQLRSRSLTTAQAEASTAERILTDWQGLQRVDAVTQPFRVTNPDEAMRFADSLVKAFAGGLKGEFVIAIAIVSANVYGEVPRVEVPK